MQKRILFILIYTFVVSNLFSQGFRQNFNSSPNLSSYVSNAPNSGQFNELDGNIGSVHVEIDNGRLKFKKTGNSWHSGMAVRNTNLPGNSTTLMFQFDMEIAESSSNKNDAVIFQVGSGFSHTLFNVEPNNNVYAQFGINAMTGNNYRVRNITANTVVNTTITGANKRVTWVMNNGGAAITYFAPNGTTETLGEDKMDLWIGTTRLMNDVGVQNNGQHIRHFKIYYTRNSNIALYLDNFNIHARDANFNGGDLTIGANGDYPSFTNIGGLFEDVMNFGSLTGNLNLAVISDIAGETGTFSLGEIPGMEQYTTKIFPSSAVLRNISSSANVATNGMFFFNGADKVIMDGRAPGDNSENANTPRYLRISNTHTNSPTIHFRNGAQQNQIQFCTIEGRSTNVNQAVCLVGDAISSPTANRDIVFRFNHIRNSTGFPRHGILLSGSNLRESRNIRIDNNHIYNAYISASNSSSIAIGDNLRNIEIVNNHVYQNEAVPAGHSATYISIIGGRSGGNSNNADSLIITNNYIGGSGPFCSGLPWTNATGANMPLRIRGIDIRIPNTNYALIEGNVINNFRMNFTRTNNTNEYSFRGIFINSGKADVINNRIGSRDSLIFSCNANNTAGLISTIGIEYSGVLGSVRGNRISGMRGIFGSASAMGFDIIGIRASANAPGVSFENNYIGIPNQSASIRVASHNSANSIRGIFSTANGANLTEIRNNYIVGLVDSSTSNQSQVSGIWHMGTSGVILESDTIENLVSFSASEDLGNMLALAGIRVVNGNNQTEIFKSHIHGLRGASASAASKVAAIVADGAGMMKIYSNRIYNLTHANTTVGLNQAIVSGIHTGSSSNALIALYNNMISLGLNPNGTSNNQRCGMIGIWDSNTLRTQPVQISYNSVLIAGAESGASNATYAFYRGNRNAGILNAPIYIANNIFNNARTGTSKHTSIANDNSASAWTLCDNNALSAVQGSSFAQWGDAWVNFANWKTNTLGDNSSTIDNIFVVSTPLTACSGATYAHAATADLHLPMCEVRVNTKGRVIHSPIAIYHDFDGDFRRGCDIGADEVKNIKTFTGTTSTAWHVDANWDYKQKPTCADSVILAPNGTSITRPAGNINVTRQAILAANEKAYFKDLEIRSGSSFQSLANSSLEGCWWDGKFVVNGSVDLQGAHLTLAGDVEVNGITNAGNALWHLNNDSLLNDLLNNHGMRDWMASFNQAHDSISIYGSAALIEAKSLVVKNEGIVKLNGSNNQTLRLKENGTFCLRGLSELITNSNHLDIRGTVDATSTGWLLSDAQSRVYVHGTADVIGALSFKDGFNYVKKLVVNRDGNGELILGNTIIVTDSLVMQKGVLTTSKISMLILDNNAKVIGTGSATNYIKGPVKKNFNQSGASVHLPVGKEGKFRAVGLQADASTPTTFTVEYFPVNPDSAYPIEARIDPSLTVKNKEMWMIDRSPAVSGAAAYVTLHWGEESDVSDQGYDMMRLRVSKWDALENVWLDMGPDDMTAGGSSLSGSVKSDLITKFSPFTLATIEAHPLPVEILSFTAEPMNADILTTWTTLSETNNHYFVVERSTDASFFMEIGRVNGAGNSTTVRHYDFLDVQAMQSHSGVIYYRLKQVDFNGMFSYSDIVPVQIAQQNMFQLMHATFADGGVLSGVFTANKAGIAHLTCFDMAGKMVLNTKISAQEGTNMLNEACQVQLARGVYTMQLVFEGKAETLKMVYAGN